MSLKATLRPARLALEYGVFRAVAALLRALPLERAADLSGALWRMAAPRMSRHARALRHLAWAFPDATQQDREIMARGMWENLGRVFAEALHIDRFGAEPDRLSMPDDALLREIAARGRGMVAVSLHAGNWEIVTLGAARIGMSASGVYQAIKNPHVDAYITTLRHGSYPGGLHTKGHDTPRRLLRALRSGGLVAMLADLRDVRGEPVTFFGRPAPSTVFPALLARMNDSPLVAARIVRLPGSRFRLDAVEIMQPRTEDRDSDIRAVTQAIQHQFEVWIREHPEQWMWAHRRWG